MAINLFKYHKGVSPLEISMALNIYFSISIMSYLSILLFFNDILFNFL